MEWSEVVVGRIRKALAEREQAIREKRVAEKRRVVGRKAVLKIPHTDTPTTASSPRSLRPALACKDDERRQLELDALKDFRARYAEARKRWSAGHRRTAFPTGTYRMLAFGIRCVAPPPLI